MAKKIEKLSALRIAKYSPGCHGDGANLWLQVGPTGGRSWLFRYRFGGKARNMGLGPVHTVSLAEAREKAREARKLLLDGLDPGAEKRSRLEAIKLAAAVQLTFDQCAEKYISAHRTGWRNPKHAAQWENTLATYASPIIGGVSAANVNTALVLRVLEPIWAIKTETASRLRGRIEAILDWAKVRGYRSGENPARWKGHLDKMLPARAKVKAVEHHPALQFSETAAFLVDLRRQEGVTARALEFAILTAARSGEVRGATWGEVDLRKAVWVVPRTRMKAGKEHHVPLSDAALHLLRALPRFEGVDLVFPAPRGGQLSDMAMTVLLRRMGLTITAHGFRSSFRDWAGETTAYPREVIEHALAHQLRDKTEAAYQRGALFDKRRRLMGDWATYCCTIKGDGGGVVAIRGGTA
ncbi:MAG: integrase arm-type DNA-binding domain-containing protein [Zoogloeaceae bacterium]|nr:integrase arm-type DNA-binding domain-containing protein [Zoogloeaceae bacterium]MCK6385685.1 integrase arm-type DNA-binding domain-containing protein [Rhodocyclaceae bacterium]